MCLNVMHSWESEVWWCGEGFREGGGEGGGEDKKYNYHAGSEDG